MRFPKGVFGQRNEPLYVVEVAKKIGEIKGAGFDEILTITTGNARNVLGMEEDG